MTDRVLPSIDDVLREFQSHLQAAGLLEPDNAANVQVWMKGATSGTPDAPDMTGSAERAAHFSQVLGVPVQVLDASAEADCIYRSVLRNQAVSSQQSVATVSIGETTTLLAFGKGLNPERKPNNEERPPARLDIGWERLLLGDAIGPADVRLAQLDVTTQLTEAGGDAWRNVMQGRVVFLEKTLAYRCLQQLAAHLAGESSLPLLLAAGDGDSLSAEFLTDCLAPEGLDQLNRAYQEHIVLASERQSDAISKAELFGLLIILKALADFLAIERFQVGTEGGLNAGLLGDMAQRQIQTRNDTFGELLHERYDQTHAQVRRVLEGIFPEFQTCLESRIKDRVSIAHKLNKSALSPHPQTPLLHTLEAAARRITDGHGFALVLNRVTPAALATVRNGILRAIGAGQLEVLALKNYHGSAPDAPPYFNDNDIDRIRLAMERRWLQTSPDPNEQGLTVIQGDDALKPSGYTCTQLRMRLKNPATEAFDLPDVDFHICGQAVYDFYRGADHLVYEIDTGKDLYQGSATLRERFEPEIRPLLDAMAALSEETLQRFTTYRSAIYAYRRQLESGVSSEFPASSPEPPADLPEACRLDNLTRLSNLREQWSGLLVV